MKYFIAEKFQIFFKFAYKTFNCNSKKVWLNVMVIFIWKFIFYI